MIDTKARIIANEKIAQGFFKLVLQAPRISSRAKAGQFVMVRCSNDTDPFLRRPFSFHRIGKNNFEVVYKIVGKGTEILSNRKKREILDVLGPLGNGFDVDQRPKTKDQKILVGGGIGVAPLYALAEKLITGHQVSAFIGARKKEHIICENDFKKLGVKTFVATEDGTKGYKGLVTDLLTKNLYAKRYTLNAVIYACGPRPMLKKVSEIVNLRKIPCQVSLEERMACGTGACLGCAVNTRNDYKMVCKDGPIFNTEDIIW